jgi:hypothetical protein
MAAKYERTDSLGACGGRHIVADIVRRKKPANKL